MRKKIKIFALLLISIIIMSTGMLVVCAEDSESIEETDKEGCGEIYIDGYWYFFDPDTGEMKKSGFAYIPEQGKWCYYDEQGHMLYGEQYIDGGWYYLTPGTGAVDYEWAYLPEGQKWCYYGPEGGDGRMRYKEQCINGLWYYFNDISGAVTYGFSYIPEQEKWVYYQPVSGIMQYGEQCIDGSWYYLDNITGAVTYGWCKMPQGNAEKWVYYSWPDGKMKYGEQIIYGKRYLFDNITGALIKKPGSSQRPAGEINYRNDLFGMLVDSEEIKSVRLIGDSISVGLSSADYIPLNGKEIFTENGWTYREGSYDVPSFANYMRVYLNERGIEFLNAGISEKTMKYAWENREIWIGDESDTLIVMLGINDAEAEALEEYLSYAENFLEYANSKVKHLFVISPTPAVNIMKNFSMSEANDGLRKLCELHGWNFYPMYEGVITKFESFGIPESAFLIDGIHPSKKTHKIMWDSFAEMAGL